jgi:hypothetical protein
MLRNLSKCEKFGALFQRSVGVILVCEASQLRRDAPQAIPMQHHSPGVSLGVSLGVSEVVSLDFQDLLPNPLLKSPSEQIVAIENFTVVVNLHLANGTPCA